MSSRTYHASEVISVMAFVSVIYLYYIGLYSIVFVREPDPEEAKDPDLLEQPRDHFNTRLN